MSQTALPVSKSEKLLGIFSLLSPEKQDQVLDFIEFLHKKYDPAPGGILICRKNFWKDFASMKKTLKMFLPVKK